MGPRLCTREELRVNSEEHPIEVAPYLASRGIELMKITQAFGTLEYDGDSSTRTVRVLFNGTLIGTVTY